MSEYIHAVLLLHSAKKEINEENLANVIKAAGLEPDPQRIKLIISSLEGVDIDKVLSSASFMAPPAAVPQQAAPQQKPEEKPKEEKKEEKEEEIAGLGALFE